MHDPFRPTFELDSSLDAEDALRVLRALVEAGGPLSGFATGPHLTLTVRRAEQHFWSPVCQLEVLETERDGSRVFGRFTPKPAVWTGFIMTYLALGTIMFFAACFGLSFLVLERSAAVLWVLPAGALIAAAMAVLSRIGQRLAREQMGSIRRGVELALGVPDQNESVISTSSSAS